MYIIKMVIVCMNNHQVHCPVVIIDWKLLSVVEVSE